ncbi:MAG: glycosyltransferase family 2 protein [Deltaproteobacteria bacterium]|nr:glycosyltransferase family 2 protein [Deltaproteobacteria bacterium]
MTGALNISVIMPVYNSAKTIRATLDSVLAQTLSPLEIILVDDGSQDETLNTLKSYSRKYPSIKVYSQSNAGPASARNRGVSYARGEWIAFLDSDDYWYPHHLENLANVIQHHPELQWASAAFERQVGQKLIPERLRISDDQDLLDSYLSAVLKGHAINTNTVLIRREAFLEMNGFREDWQVSEDSNLWYRFGIHFPGLGYSHVISSRYNYTPDSISNKKNEEKQGVKLSLRSLDAAIQYAQTLQVMDRRDVQQYLCNQLNAILKTCILGKSKQFRSILRDYRKQIPGFSLHWKTVAYYCLSCIPGCSPTKIAILAKSWFRR